jgi:endonuclease I
LSERAFEVIDEFKGDVARAYFYYQLTYHGTATNYSPFIAPFPYFSKHYLKTYIKWAKEDPVDAFDIQRNNGIYKSQGNRNPFSDYPALVDLIFLSNDKTFVNQGVTTSMA